MPQTTAEEIVARIKQRQKRLEPQFANEDRSAQMASGLSDPAENIIARIKARQGRVLENPVPEEKPAARGLPARGDGLFSIPELPPIAALPTEPRVKVPEAPSRGFIGDIVSGTARGFGPRLSGTAGNVLKFLDQPGGIDIARNVGEKLTKFEEEAPQKADIFKPSIQETSKGISGLAHRGAVGTFADTPSSLVPSISGAWLGAKAGGFITAGNPIGIVTGGLIGGALATLFIFGAGEYNKFFEEAKRKGVDDETARKGAARSAVIEGVIEAATVPVELLTAGFGGEVVNQPFKQAIRTMFKVGGKEMAGRIAKTMAVEVGTEELQSVLEVLNRRDIGLDTPSIQEAMTETFLPAAGMTFLFGAGTHGLNKLEERRVRKAVADPTVPAEQRMNAVGFIAQNLASQDQELAKSWAINAILAVNRGKSIDIDEKTADFAKKKYEAELQLGIKDLEFKPTHTFEGRPVMEIEKNMWWNGSAGIAPFLSPSELKPLPESAVDDGGIIGKKIAEMPPEQEGVPQEELGEEEPPAGMPAEPKTTPGGISPAGEALAEPVPAVGEEAGRRAEDLGPPLGIPEQREGERRIEPEIRAHINEFVKKAKEGDKEAIDELYKNFQEEHGSGLLNMRGYGLMGEKPAHWFMDLNGFKKINDTLGHDAGDQILKAVGESILKHVEKEKGFAVARRSGDEFVAKADSIEEMQRIAAAIDEDLKNLVIEIQMPDGTIQKQEGISFAWGIGGGKDEKEAEKAAQKQKEEQLEAGLREARPENPVGKGIPPIVTPGGEGIAGVPEKAGGVKPEPTPPPLPEGIEKPPIAPQDQINAITRNKAGKMIVAGDESVMEHIREGVKKLGSTQMSDAVRNEILSELSQIPKGPEREAARENVAKLQDRIDAALRGEEEKPKISSEEKADEARKKIQEKLLPKEKTLGVQKPGIEKTEIDKAAQEAAASPNNRVPEPTEAQKEAGNYKKGHISIAGLDISIENPEGSVRSGIDENGDPWETPMVGVHYGYIKRTEDADEGDQIDVFVRAAAPLLGEEPATERVFVINQLNPEGNDFDEHKVMLGFDTKEQAQTAYLQQYEKGWKGIGNIVDFSMAEFKEWIKSGNTKEELDTSEVNKIRKKVAGKGEVQTPVEPKPEAKAPTPPPFGSTNKVFTETKAEEARRKLREKLDQVNVGLDPEMIQAGMDLAGYYIEGGARSFVAYSRKMIADLGEKIKPYLKSWYMAIKNYPGFDNTGMDKESVVDATDLDNLPTEEAAGEKTTTGGIREPETKPVLAGPAEIPAGEQPAGGVGTVPEEGIGVAPGPGGKPSGENVGKTPKEGEPRPGPGEGTGAGGGRGVAPRSRGGEAGAAPRGKTGTAMEMGEKGPTVVKENNRIEPDETIAPSGKVARIRANVRAIELSKEIAKTDRQATKEEKKVLQQYVGWGALSENVFKPEWTKAVDRNGSNPYGWWDSDEVKQFEKWKELVGNKLYPGLGGILTEKEWAAASSSVLNAHYTDRAVIDGMWKMAERIGITGGNILEPAGGIGHFFGLMPEYIASASNLTGVELDKISGQIFQQLYPNAKIKISGFEKSKIKDNSQDLIISNFPFGNYPIKDEQRPDYSGWNIHNYFFARSIDVLKPDGILVAITSHYTMDAVNSSVRSYLTNKADLVAAIRLPGTAFEKNAGTSVTTDIIILKKKGPVAYENPQSFRYIKPIKLENSSGSMIEGGINEYFIDNPNMVLGVHSLKGTMYGGKNEYTLLPDTGRPLSDQLKDVLDHIPQRIATSLTEGGSMETGKSEPEVGKREREGQLILRDGKILKVGPGGESYVQPSFASRPDTVRKALAYIRVKDAYDGLIKSELSAESTEEELNALRKQLNDVYDAFYKKYGPISVSVKELQEDSDFYATTALESSETKTDQVEIKTGSNKGQIKSVYKRTFRKSEIFSKRINFPFIEPDTAENLEDALNISLVYRNVIDTAYIARILNKDSEGVALELEEAGLAFKNPETGILETSEDYLSGNVKKKLEIARIRAQEDQAYERNVKALEANQPETIGIDRIHFRPGSTWIPTKTIEDYIKEKLGVQTRVTMGRVLDQIHWGIDVRYGAENAKNTDTWAAEGVTGVKMMLASLNLRNVLVYDEVEDGSGGTERILNKQKSMIAQEKQSEQQEDFRKYIRNHKEYGPEIEEIYNRLKNNRVPRAHKVPDIKHFPGASHAVELGDHQKRAVARGLREATMFAHAVGTGKTYLFITLAMEMKRLKTARKSLIVVQPSTLSSYASSFRTLYPTAKILIPTDELLLRKHRQKLLSQIRTGDYDAVIIPHSFFDLIPNDPAREEQYILEELDKIGEYITTTARKGGRKDPTVKALEKIRKKKQVRLEELAKLKLKKDNIYFETMGIDALLVDESHKYKRSEFFTKMGNIKGLDRGSSKGSFNLLQKTRFIQEKTGGKNIFLATGTPISNTMAELWTIWRYVRPDLLIENGIENFDDFATTFGEPSRNWEQTQTGDFKIVERFNKYVNGPELIALWKTSSDTVMQEDVAMKNLPQFRGGQPQEVIIDRTDIVRDAIIKIKLARLVWEKLDGKTKRELSWIPLRLQNLAKQIATDVRLIDSSAPDDPGSKLNRVVREVFDRWRATESERSTQIIFSDSIQSSDGKFNVYEDIKKKLIDMGVPSQEIALPSDYDSQIRKERMWGLVNSGNVRVIMGSTGKLGTGTNVQQKLLVEHLIDVPYRPMDHEQRVGRIRRPGNENPIIDVLVYGVKQTLDSSSFQLLQGKQKMLNQVLRGDIKNRSFEDPSDEIQLTFEEMMAAFSENPYIRQRYGLENQIRELETSKLGHDRAVGAAKRALGDAEKYKLPGAETSLAGDKKTLVFLEETHPGGKVESVEIDGIVQKEKIGESIETLFEKKRAAIQLFFDEHKATPNSKSPEGAVFEIKINGRAIRILPKIYIESYKATESDKDISRRIREITFEWTDDYGLTEDFSKWKPGDYFPGTISGGSRTGEGLIKSIREITGAERWRKLIKKDEERISSIKTDIEELKQNAAKKWDRDNELEDKKKEHAEVMEKLGASKDADTGMSDEDLKIGREFIDKIVGEAAGRKLAKGAKKAKGGVTLSFMGIGAGYDLLVEDLKALKSGTEAASVKLQEIGMKIIQEGHSKLKSFTDRMREVLGDIYDKFKHMMLKVFNKVKDLNKQMGERGSITVGKGRAGSPFVNIDEVRNYIEESPDYVPNAHVTEGNKLKLTGKVAISSLAQAADGMTRAFYPLALGEKAEKTGYIIGEEVAKAERAIDIFMYGAKEADKAFSRMSKEDAIAFMQAADTGGEQINTEFQNISDALDVLWKAKVNQVHAVEPHALRQVRENYFPHIVKRKNLKAAIEAFSRRPMEGKKSFLRQRKYDDIQELLKAGFELESYNPIENVLWKIREIDKFIIAHTVKKALKGNGFIKFFRAGMRPGPGWKKLDDRFFTIIGKPEYPGKEYIDQGVYDGLINAAKAIGISHKRSASIGHGALGFSMRNSSDIETKFATETNVLAHEISHQLDRKYDLWNMIISGAVGRSWTGNVTKAASSKKRGVIQKELRALADLSWEGREASAYYKKQVRKKNEKMAHLLEVYIHAPDKFKKVAPETYGIFDNFLKSHAELKALTEIKPGIALKKMEIPSKMEGYLVKGNYYALDEVAQVVNNYLSKTLYSNKYVGDVFKAYMTTANELNNWQLGWGSLFHAGFTSFETVISQNALTLRQLWEGRYGDARKSALRTPLAWILNPMKGNKIFEEWRQPGSHPEMAEIVDAMQKAGAFVRSLSKERLLTTHAKTMHEALAEGKYIKAGINAIGALAEKSIEPTLKWLVPRQKLGVFAEFYEDYKRENPNAEPEAFQKAIWYKWNRVDARLGQVIYGRMFSNNVAKNLVQAVIRAPGWTGGTIIEIGGGIADMVKFIKDAAQGKKPVLTDRAAYTFSMVMTTMVINGILTWMLTGDDPEDKDFFAFRTSEKNAKGEHIRFMLPTYMKDLVAYWNAPMTTVLHKTHPLLSMISDIVRNKDYYGRPIAERDHNIAEKIFDVSKYGAKSFEPFWVRGVRKVQETEKGVGSKIAPFFGVMPAPKYIANSEAENLMYEIKQSKPLFPSANPDASKSRREIIDLIRKGKINRDAESIKRAIEKRGIILNSYQRHRIFQDSKESTFSDQFKRLTAKEAYEVWQVATNKEKKQVSRIFRSKIRNSKTLSSEEKKLLFIKLREYHKVNPEQTIGAHDE